jgi:hypothetical protein
MLILNQFLISFKYLLVVDSSAKAQTCLNQLEVNKHCFRRAHCSILTVRVIWRQTGWCGLGTFANTITQPLRAHCSIFTVSPAPYNWPRRHVYKKVGNKCQNQRHLFFWGRKEVLTDIPGWNLTN